MRILPMILLMLAAAGPLAMAVPTKDVPKPGAAKQAARPGTSSATAVLDLAGWLAEHSAALAIKTRTYDPFGKRKDPSAKPTPQEAKIPDDPSTQPKEPEVDAKLAFAKAVAAIKVTMIGSGQFTIAGGTTLNQGQTFKLTSEGISFKAKVVTVAAAGVVIEDTATGNRATIAGGSSANLPPGMQRGAPPSSPLAPAPDSKDNQLPNAP